MQAVYYYQSPLGEMIMTGYAGGLSRKEALLKLEGIIK